MEEIERKVKRVQTAFRTHKTFDLEFRKAQITQIKKLIQENMPELEQALKADLGVNEFFTKGLELHTVVVECDDAIENLKKWSSPRAVSTPLLMQPASSFVKPEPFGTVLIIAPWNYPISLMLAPLVSAIAAGNAAVVKPSEVSVASAAIMEKLFPKYLDPDFYQLVAGGAEETTLLLKQKWDFICYTGNGHVGRIVMRAAAENLTPTLLELGGKSPVIVADDADLTKAATRIVWGKWTMNHGQTCVTPDYILTTPKTFPALVDKLKKTLVDFYGKDPKTSPDVSRQINVRHTERVWKMIQDDPSIEILHGGESDVQNKYIAPTIVKAQAQSKIMQDEIFGPVLAIVVVDDVDKAIDFINERDKPLALYVFSENSKISQKVLDHTSSGGACVNEVCMHVGNSALPFGGVGPSGMGSYHGLAGFDAFSHHKGVLVKKGSDVPLRFPPYTERKIWWLNTLRSVKPPSARTVSLVALPVIAGVAAVAFSRL